MKQIEKYNDIRKADPDDEITDLWENSRQRLRFNKWFRAKKSGAFNLIHELNMSILSKTFKKYKGPVTLPVFVYIVKKILKRNKRNNEETRTFYK